MQHLSWSHLWWNSLHHHAPYFIVLASWWRCLAALHPPACHTVIATVSSGTALLCIDRICTNRLQLPAPTHSRVHVNWGECYCRCVTRRGRQISLHDVREEWCAGPWCAVLSVFALSERHTPITVVLAIPAVVRMVSMAWRWAHPMLNL